MAEANVAADPSMDEILEKIQRTIATEGLNGHQPAASPRPPAEFYRLRQMSDEGTAHAANEPQAASAQAAGPGVRFARHAAQFRFESRRRQWRSVRGAGPRTRDGARSARRDRRATAHRPPRGAPAARR